MLSFPTSDSKDDEKLICTCENEKGTCTNRTCRGYVCFYTWLHGFWERGCLPERTYREHCNSALPGFYIDCCWNDHCNALTTASPNISQYPKRRYFIRFLKTQG